ncbi:uncharacterized protein LOC133174936 [Saccostrea echinata]|uniref:uncharacterized protein LOC133174936 n=1 Tax=Saccostrea echinata TaxID=191078 RepID=UPI002A817358|nr:uncharacterized protein LOC133174936 [Saccostrea echinata]
MISAFSSSAFLVMLYCSTILNGVFMCPNSFDTQLDWVWEKAGVPRQDFKSDIDSKTTPAMRRWFAGFLKEKVARDLIKTEVQILELMHKSEAECQRGNNSFDVVKDFPSPENRIKLSKNEITVLKDLLRRLDIIKETLIKSMQAVKTPRCLEKCQAVSSLMNIGNRVFDFTKEFHLCSWMTQHENLEKVQEMSSVQDISSSAMLDILLVLSDNAAVTEYLMMEYMKDIRDFEQNKAEKNMKLKTE